MLFACVVSGTSGSSVGRGNSTTPNGRLSFCRCCSCNCRFRISIAFLYVSITSGTCGGPTCSGIVGSMPDSGLERGVVEREGAGTVIDGIPRGMQAHVQLQTVPSHRQAGVVSVQPAGVKGSGGLTDVLHLPCAATGKANTSTAAKARIVFILRPSFLPCLFVVPWCSDKPVRAQHA